MKTEIPNDVPAERARALRSTFPGMPDGGRVLRDAFRTAATLDHVAAAPALVARLGEPEQPADAPIGRASPL